MNPSIPRLWANYVASLGQDGSRPLPEAWHFCDNEIDADACAALVLAGRKRATAPSLWFFESRGLVPPTVGTLEIVTNWHGTALCIIRTTSVQTIPFRDVTAEHARLEAEGDGSLESWRAVHWAYYQRELSGTGFTPTQDMPIVCQYFDVVFRQGGPTRRAAVGGRCDHRPPRLKRGR